MIALCPVCHGLAEGGHWTSAQLRQFKINPKAPGSIRQRLGLPEPGRRALYRLGGNYVLSCPLILSVANRPILIEDRTPDGDFVFSFQVFDERDRPVLFVVQNSLSVEATQVWDCFVSTHGNHILIRKRRGRVALDLGIQSLSPDEFRAKLDRDLEQSASAMERIPGFEDVAGDAAHATDQRIRSRMVDDFWPVVQRECLNSDGRMSLIDVKRANLYAQGRWLAVGHGIQGGLSASGCLAWDNAGGFSVAGARRLNKHWRQMKSNFTLQDAVIVQREKLLCEIERAPDAEVSKIFEESVSTFPAMMSVASGILGTRLFQGQLL
jgi:hypothetical protein